MKLIKIFLYLVLFAGSIFSQTDLYTLKSDPDNNTLSGVETERFKAPALSLLNYPSPKFNPLKTQPDYKLLAGLGGVYLAAGIGVHIYQNNAWWKDRRSSSFRVIYDWKYALNIDKIGHFYATQLLAHAFASGLEAGNVQAEQAAIYGSIAALAFETYVEIEDGFGDDWGFSPGDAGGNLLGAGYFLAQYYYPFLKNFQFKYSYYPSAKLLEGTHKGGGIIDDYEGEIYWLSMRVKNLLPEKLSEIWPSFLNIAAGYGVRDLDGSGGGTMEFYIAFDFDAESIPLYGRGWEFVKNTLNYFHFPMPGIRITPDAAFFMFVF